MMTGTITYVPTGLPFSCLGLNFQPYIAFAADFSIAARLEATNEGSIAKISTLLARPALVTNTLQVTLTLVVAAGVAVGVAARVYEASNSAIAAHKCRQVRDGIDI